MVKADPKQDYYADLEISPNADGEEIRKQFRKLALKWHPDRNPGKEAECVPRFQAIQAAHEILGDPDQRQKYDAERRKRGVHATTTRSGAPRGNPYQATSNFPPPPRRTAARPTPQPARPEYTSTASHGASRFAQFPKPPPTSQKADFKRNAEEKANVFNAWQNMNHRPKAPSQGAMPEGYARARSAWEAANEGKPSMGRSNSTRTPRRGGFNPATPGADEPQAAGTSGYYRRPVPPVPPGASTQQYPDLPRNLRETLERDVPFAEGTRVRTPYNSMGGERTFVDPLRRSASQRSSSRQADPSEDQSAQSTAQRSTMRGRSASAVGGKGNATRPFTMYSSSEDEEPQEAVSPGRHTADATKSQTASSAQAGASTNEDSSQANSTTNINGGFGESSQSTMYDNLYLHQQKRGARQSHQKWPYWAYPSSVAPPQASSYISPSKSGCGNFSHAHAQPPTTCSAQQSNNSANSGFSFTFPITAETFTQTKADQAKSNSTESINTKFSPGDWHGKFEGNADYFAGPIPPASSRTRTSPIRSRPPSASKNRTQGATFGASQFSSPPRSAPRDQPPPISTSPEAPINPGTVRFSQEEWAKTFRDPSFVLPVNQPKPPSPAKGPTATRRMKQPKSRANMKPQPASVADYDSSDDNDSSAKQTDTADGSAMDIDPTPDQPTATNGASKGPRMVPVPPLRPEWREQPQEKAVDGGDTMRLDDLKNVAPFAASSEGLKNLNDLTTTLPFESRPSAFHPTRPTEPGSLRLPEMPKAPEVPQRITKTSWIEHVRKMGSYMDQFNQFDSQMLQHFAARHREVEAMGTPTVWLNAVGDTTTGGGFGSYMQGVKEDERARMHWNVGWEKHRTTLDAFEGCRTRVLKGGLAN